MPAQPPLPAAGTHIPVLVIEDDLILSDLVQDILQETRFQVVGVARSAAEAIALAERTQPRLAVVDLALEGGLDGLDAARRLRERFGTAIVLVTGWPAAEARARAVANPPALLRKPFLARQLLTLLDEAAAGPVR